MNTALSGGYKQTEVGALPQDWQVAPLGRLVSSVEYGSSAKSDVTGAIPVLRMGNLQGGKIDWDDLVYTDDALEIGKYTLRPGDVLFNRTNTIDLVGKTSIYLGEQPAIFAGYLIRINVLRHLLDSSYLNYILNTELAKKYSAKVLSVAVGQANINGQKLKTYPIPHPPTLAEQTAIATALSDADALIESLEKLVAKKRQIKHGTMQQLLTGQKRLVGFTEKSTAYKQSDCGPIPKDWEPAFIEDFARITTGGKNTQDRVEDGLYPFFVRSQTVEHINSYSFDGEAVLTAGDGVGTGKVFHYIKGRFDAHQRVYRISDFNERVIGYFFFLYFSTHFYARIMQMTAKSSVDSIRREMIARMPIPVPPTRGEQEAIAAVISDMDAEIETLKAKLAKARQVKQGMMQELLTGRIRLI